MNFNKIIIVICLLTVAVLLNSCNTEKEVNITSPNGDYKFDCFVNKNTGELNYSVSFLGNEIIKPSVLGFKVNNDEQPLNIVINNIVANSVNSSWQPVYGEKNEYPDIYSEKIILISDNKINYKLN